MNVCLFTGFLVEDPTLQKRDGASYIEFQLAINSYRRNKKTNDKSRTVTYLYFEAYSSGAETIANLGRRGSKMTVKALARNPSDDDGEVTFRVEEFDFACLEED